MVRLVKIEENLALQADLYFCRAFLDFRSGGLEIDNLAPERFRAVNYPVVFSVHRQRSATHVLHRILQIDRGAIDRSGFIIQRE